MKFIGNKYIFILAIIAIIAIFLYNVITGNKGTYMDHSRTLWNEALNTLRIPFMPQDTKSNTTRQIRDSSGEMECRRVAEMLTGKPFPKKRPDFLKNTITDGNLEIDCYCDELKLGIEYNGAQHYKYIPYFHSSKDAFYNTKYRDDMKGRLCALNGVKLIIVPYTVAVNDIEAYLRERM